MPFCSWKERLLLARKWNSSVVLPRMFCFCCLGAVELEVPYSLRRSTYFLLQ